jgi:hypothetical protein
MIYVLIYIYIFSFSCIMISLLGQFFLLLTLLDIAGIMIVFKLFSSSFCVFNCVLKLHFVEVKIISYFVFKNLSYSSFN